MLCDQSGMRVAILGGGFQGCCTALALARHGASVVIYERHPALLAGAATANEGKIHLGYVYASDRSLATARTMIRGGLCFAPLVQSYLEASGPLATSRPFFYAVHRDSQVAADDVAAHLAATHELLIQSPDAANYFGVDLSVPPQRLTQAALEARFDPAHVSAAFDTPEIAIDSRAVAVAISRRIAEDPNIELRLGRTVTAVEGDEGRLSVRANGLYHADIDAFTCVVNALWDGRLAIDATRNIHPGRRWIHRFKHGIRFRLTEGAALPSVTIVLGPFGDVVDYGDGQFYISWYPACMLAHSDAVVPPAWNPEPEEPLRSQIVDETFLAIGAIVPQLLGVHPEAVDVKAGVIVAWGHTDIDDHASELHNRHAIGVHSYGNFHSIDPGKLTMAPYFAENLRRPHPRRDWLMTEPLIAIGVPVWRAADFVAETLESALNQRGVRFKLIVSIDGADEESEQACRAFASDTRVRIIAQPRRLGWVRNTAAVLQVCQEHAEFVCLLPHDDLIEPDYLATLLEAANAEPQAAVVFSDMTIFEGKQATAAQDSVRGSPLERQLALLTRHFNAIAYRGLTRTPVLRAVPPMSNNDCGDFGCDALWMTRLAREGELIRVPEALYRKRYTGRSAHTEWLNWPMEQKIAAWVGHCLDMLAEALTVAQGAGERRRLIEAARRRLLLREKKLGPYAKLIRAMRLPQRWRMQADFEARAASRADIGPLGFSPKDLLFRLAGRIG